MAGDGMHMKAHEQTYTGFLSLLKFGSVAVAVIVAVVVLLIAS